MDPYQVQGGVSTGYRDQYLCREASRDPLEFCRPGRRQESYVELVAHLE